MSLKRIFGSRYETLVNSFRLNYKSSFRTAAVIGREFKRTRASNHAVQTMYCFVGTVCCGSGMGEEESEFCSLKLDPRLKRYRYLFVSFWLARKYQDKGWE